MRTIFPDRREAGARLAQALIERGYADEEVQVLAIPRGGVIVAAEVARSLHAPLDVVITRRLRAPHQPEVAVGAVVSGNGGPLLEAELARATGASAEYLDQEVRAQQAEIARRMEAYRGERPLPDLAGRTVIVVDDGIATGFTFQAALQALRRQGAGRLVAAVPVGPQESVAELRPLADEVVCLATPEPFLTVACWYQDFRQNTDEEVVALLEESIANCKLQIANCELHGPAAEGRATKPPSDDPETLDTSTGQSAICNDIRAVTIPVGEVRLPGLLQVPANARTVVLFAHGRGSGRQSPRNAFVARVLREAGFGTLLFDLLEEQEQAERSHVFDIDLLTERLLGATEWVRQQPETLNLPVCYFGASTGAAAALQAAAREATETAGYGSGIAAIVSRGGRPDLAGVYLPRVQAPTLLIVGGNDTPVLGLNEAALGTLRCPKELVIVPGAGHVFEEPGTLEEAARLARDWFVRCLEGPQAVEESPAPRKITLTLTREQQLQLAATTGVMVGVLEIDPEDLAAGRVPWAQVPGLSD